MAPGPSAKNRVIMGYREVKVYDGAFPTREQILSGDPAAPPFPKESWLQHVHPGEFAVRYADFKAGLARNAQGEHVQSSEICRIFDNLEEARANSRQVSAQHWTVMCVLYDHTGTQLEKVSNSKEVGKFALSRYAAILFWGAVYTLGSMGFIWIAYRMTRVLLVRRNEPAPALNWTEWCAFAVVGILIAIAAWFLKLRYSSMKRVRKIRSQFSPEEMKYFEELNTLHGTSDPAERERFLKLMREYQDRVSRALKE
jgi:hypothetical protein